MTLQSLQSPSHQGMGAVTLHLEVPFHEVNSHAGSGHLFHSALSLVPDSTSSDL